VLKLLSHFRSYKWEEVANPSVNFNSTMAFSGGLWNSVCFGPEFFINFAFLDTGNEFIDNGHEDI
jgi:hypothetical protein